MNLQWIDWSIVAGLFITLFIVINICKRYTNSVSGFLSANRCAGRYLLGISEQMASMGAISLISLFQIYWQGGFTIIWWQQITAPIGILLALTGFVIYRYRQTRVFTLAEFFERRYSKNFRIFAGFLIFLSGILNFGIFPGIGSHFFIHFCGFPQAFTVGPMTLSTYPVLMAILLGISLYFTYRGGQLGVMLTDFIQAIFSYVVLLLIMGFIFVSVKWSYISEALLKAPENASLINPFRGSSIPDFNVWFWVMYAILMIYQYRAWQGAQGYNCAALNPHEAKMGGIMGVFRGYVLHLTVLMLPIVTYTFLNHPHFASIADEINSALNQIGDEQLKNRMIVPVAMSRFLKTGMIGAFAAVVLAAFVSTHDTYLHSWGSIFIQDVIMPFRKKPFSEKQHMHLLRWSILGVAVFIFFFSLVYQPKEAIQLYFRITGAIYLGGAGSVIIGGLYWRRGTTLAAYCSIIIGATLSLSGIIFRAFSPDFFLNGMHISFLAAIISVCTYVVVSLIWPNRNPCDMDKLLHRGKYAIKDDTIAEVSNKGILAKLGITKEFTRGDKFIYWLAFSLSFFFFGTFLIGSMYQWLVAEIPDSFWLKYWYCYLCLIIVFSVSFTVWMILGGIRDIFRMFKLLKSAKPDESDDGWVTEKDNHN